MNKKIPLVAVQWEDAWGSAGWTDDADNNTGVMVTSVGFMTQNNKDGITLVQGVADGTNLVLGSGFIPRKMVRKVKRIRT